MDQQLRREILKAVVESRKVLEADVLKQLEGIYGVGRDGSLEPTEKVSTLVANPALARERLEIETAILRDSESKGKDAPADAVARFVREVAFTYLNRFAALKIMESRRLIPDSLSRITDSQGYKLFQQVAPGFTRGEVDRGYRAYLEFLFDEIAVEVPLLFDRSVPQAIIFPTESALREVLERLNEPQLDPAWQEEETIGWVYQYFTPAELRKQAHKESQAPRDAYELSFRNQFYTPAYVVQFLADNTLGRLWYEMKPDTAIVGKCQYMVLQPGEESSGWEKREKKDPKEIRVLDPACGSGHFLLYSFDLLAQIYEEEGFTRQEIPGLILKHNLHGIDIDLRATQIAALALYLKAKAYDPAATIERSNIVYAEPLPGDEGLFKEFFTKLGKTTLQKLAAKVWTEMEQADEVGSLLRVQETLREAIQQERHPHSGRRKSEADQLQFDVEDWEDVEEEILGHLKEYAEQAVNGQGIQRRMFAHDLVEGFRFIDVLCKKYDVVLMNPPFGAASKGSKGYIDKNYPRTKNDLYAAFVERGLALLHAGGKLGAITSRTGFFLSSFQKWREEILLKEARLTVMADLGAGVLDSAMVETAAYCLEALG